MGLKKSLLLFSYRAVGEKIPALLFTDLKKNMAKAGMRLSFQAYVGVTLVASMLTAVGTGLTTGLLLPLFMTLPLLATIIIAIGLGILGAAVTIAVFYAYPSIMASSRAGRIDASISHIANYMSVLASAGVTPEKMFHSMVRAGKDLRVEREVQMIVRDIELFGVDLFSALRTAAEKSPSKKLAALLDGIIASAHSGGDLAGYLRSLSNRYLQERSTQLSKFLDNLGVISEIYITFMVAAPLLLVVMLSVLSVLGGEIGSVDPQFILYLMAYIGLPIGVFFILLILDSIIPPW